MKIGLCRRPSCRKGKRPKKRKVPRQTHKRKGAKYPSEQLGSPRW